MFSPLHDSQRTLCSRVGIDPKKIVPLEKVPHVESEELFFVTPPWHYGATYLKMARAFNLGLSSPSSIAPMKRIYISRERCTHGKITNEDQLMAELTRLDFEKVSPEMLNFDDQVALFGQAEVIIGAHGAGLTDLIFSKPGCKVLEIRNPTFDASETYQARGGNIFWRFSQFLNFDYCPFFARADQTFHRAPEGQVVEPVRLPNLTVDVNRLTQLLRPILDGS
jgi:capsular polysaccharide biosynthesis protein